MALSVILSLAAASIALGAFAVILHRTAFGRILVYGGSLASGTATDIQLTTAWNVNASYEHFWNPRWRTSIYGGYAQVKYSDAANAALCFEIGGVTDSCSMNWNTWWVGSRTQWNVTKDFYMGLDVLYSKMQSATWFADSTGSFAINAAGNTSGNPLKDVDNLSFRFRVHRDFYP